MPKFIVAGNWKMHGSFESVRVLTRALVERSRQETIEGLDELVVLPPAIFMSEVATLLRDSGIAWGAQDVSDKTQGAFTGQIAASMLKDFGCKYTLVGHSERRAINGESPQLVAEKFAQAQAAGITPILCIGESKDEREQGKTEQVLSEQILPVIERFGVLAFANAILAYEPVWAIGTGLAATPEMAEETHNYCRNLISEYNGQIAKDLTILYGGSVKADNAAKLFAQPNINGALVGGASLNADEFWGIASAAKRY